MDFCKNCYYCKNIKIYKKDENSNKCISEFDNITICELSNTETYKYNACEKFIEKNKCKNRIKVTNEVYYMCRYCFSKTKVINAFNIDNEKSIVYNTSTYPKYVTMRCNRCYKFSDFFSVDNEIMSSIIQILNTNGYKSKECSGGYANLIEVNSKNSIIDYKLPYIVFKSVKDLKIFSYIISNSNFVYTDTMYDNFYRYSTIIDNSLEDIMDDINKLAVSYPENKKEINLLINKFNNKREESLHRLYNILCKEFKK